MSSVSKEISPRRAEESLIELAREIGSVHAAWWTHIYIRGAFIVFLSAEDDRDLGTRETPLATDGTRSRPLPASQRILRLNKQVRKNYVSLIGSVLVKPGVCARVSRELR